MMVTSWLAPVAGIALLTLLSACSPDSSGDPCDLDRYGCQDGLGGFEIDPTCELTGELVVEAGHGENEFIALAPGDLVPAEFGSQGGQHLFGAFRVLNADLTRYDMLSVVVEVQWASSEETMGYRDIVLGLDEPIPTASDGAVEVSGLLVFLVSWPRTVPKRLVYTVQDPCGRTGTAVHEIPAG